jgi:leishmanolysin-like peptidase
MALFQSHRELFLPSPPLPSPPFPSPPMICSQYFDELTGIPAEDLPYYGGSVEIADYCPFSQEFSWHLSGEYQRSSDCRILENQPG